MAFRGAQHAAHSPPPPPTARQSVTSIDVTAHGPTSDVRRDDPPMRSCHLALALIGTTLHGALALDRRPAISIRPSSRSHDILRGGAGNKHPVVPPLVQGRVKTICRCIMATNVISFLMLVHLALAGSNVHFVLVCSTAQVFNFVAQRLLRAWRPREFDQACVEMSQTPQRLLDLVLSITRNVVLVLVSRRAISGSGRRA